MRRFLVQSPCFLSTFKSYPWIPSFSNMTSISHFKSEFSGLSPNEWLSSHSQQTLCGRLVLKRSAGKNLVFMSLQQNGDCVQIALKSSEYKDHGQEFHELMAQLSLGDILQVRGYPGKTKTGELTLMTTEMTVLAPCKKHLSKFQGISDIDLRYSKRHLDLLSNPSTVSTLRMRSLIIQKLRDALHSNGFIEVETPILSQKVGGANAKPFETFLNATQQNLYLRIAPELYLKQLVIGGFEKVFEIGKQFRNEGLDGTHSPEFTSLEVYEAYTDLNTVKQKVEKLIRDLVYSIRNTHVVSFTMDAQGPPVEINFEAPFCFLSVVPELEKKLGQKLPNWKEPSTDSLKSLLDLAQWHHVPVHKPFTIPRILDAMISHFIEPFCIQPTFVYGHPTIMSPLAKESDIPGISDRFELYIAGKEFMNAYNELNDPQEQALNLDLQQKDRDSGDVEALGKDTDYIEALEYGLPPTVGWGLGIDRLCMLLANTKSIRDVIPFPLHKT